jgi:hypothetical protein
MVIVAPVAAGCYTFTPIPVEPTPVGENVRVYVTRTGAPEVLTVAEEVGAVPEIRGRVEGEESGSLLLRTPVRSETATRALDIGQLVRVPTGEIVAMERQSFSTGRTVALLAGGIGAAAFVLYVIIDSGRGDNGVDTPDPDLFVGGLRGLRIPIGW